MLQALYYCAPFRERVLECGAGEEGASLLTHLAELFRGIDLKKKRTSLTLLRKFIVRLRKENGGHRQGCVDRGVWTGVCGQGCVDRGVWTRVCGRGCVDEGV